MGRRAAIVLVALLCTAGRALCADPAGPAVSRERVVRTLLDRSRLLDDVRFRIPVPLWELYRREELLAPRAPVPVIAERGVYRLELPADGDATLTAAVRLRVLDARHAGSIAVLDAGRAWENVRVNGEPARPATESGMLVLAPDEPGAYAITAETTIDGPREFDVRVPRTARTLVEVASPRAWRVSADGAATDVLGDADGTRGRLAVPPTDRLRLAWSRPAPHYRRSPQYRLDGAVNWNLDLGRQQVTAELAVSIVAGETDRIDLRLPADARRVEITGPDVREVRASGGRAVVHLTGVIAQRTRLRVTFERPAAEGRTPLGTFGVGDGRWAGGTLVVTDTAGSREVLAGDASGLEPIALADVPPAAAAILPGPAALAYRVTGDFALSVDALDLGEYALQETIADMARFQIAVVADGTVYCKARYEIRNRTRQFVRVDLPPGATVLLARVNDEPATPTRVPDAENARYLPLVRSRASVLGLVSFPLEIVYCFRTGALAADQPGRARAAIPLPRIDLPVAYAWCEAYLPEEMDVERWSGPLAQVAKYSTETAEASLSYGSAELAEGYDAETRMQPTSRLIPPDVPARPQWSEAERASLTRQMRVPRPARPAATQPSTQPPPPQPSGGEFLEDTQVDFVIKFALKQDLAANYFRSGYDLYEKGDLDQAADALRNARRLAPGTPEAANAERLLANIKALRGEKELTSREEKAGAAQAQSEVAASNVMVLERQQEMLEKGFEAARQGRKEEARVQLEAARSLGEKLVQRGLDRQEQAARLREATEVLDTAHADRLAEARRLDKEGERLRKSRRLDEARERYARALTILREENAPAGEIRTLQEKVAWLTEMHALMEDTRGDGAARDAEESADVRRSEIPWHETVKHPRDWSEITRRREPAAPAETPTARTADSDERITRIYDVRDLVAVPPQKSADEPAPEGGQGGGLFGGPDDEDDVLFAPSQPPPDELDARERLKAVAGQLANEGASVSEMDGQLVVTAGEEQQRRMAARIAGLRAAAGPQVAVRENITQQRASGKLSASSRAGTFEAGRPATHGDVRGTTGGVFFSDDLRGSNELREFIERNYNWADATDGGLERGRVGETQGDALRRQVVERFYWNLEQAVPVASMNLNVSPAAAEALGVRWRRGDDGVRRATIDDAQFRTLRQLAERRAGGVGEFRRQAAIVGTDALLANSMTANAVFAGESANTLLVNGDVVELPHEQYLLLYNGQSVTAVRVGAMRHWREAEAAEDLLPEVPAEFNVPRVGRLVRFEKTLVQPTDDLVLRAEYEWKGAVR